MEDESKIKLRMSLWNNPLVYMISDIGIDEFKRLFDAEMEKCKNLITNEACIHFIVFNYFEGKDELLHRILRKTRK